MKKIMLFLSIVSVSLNAFHFNIYSLPWKRVQEKAVANALQALRKKYNHGSSDYKVFTSYEGKCYLEQEVQSPFLPKGLTEYKIVQDLTAKFQTEYLNAYDELKGIDYEMMDETNPFMD